MQNPGEDALPGDHHEPSDPTERLEREVELGGQALQLLVGDRDQPADLGEPFERRGTAAGHPGERLERHGAGAGHRADEILVIGGMRTS